MFMRVVTLVTLVTLKIAPAGGRKWKRLKAEVQRLKALNVTLRNGFVTAV